MAPRAGAGTLFASAVAHVRERAVREHVAHVALELVREQPEQVVRVVLGERSTLRIIVFLPIRISALPRSEMRMFWSCLLPTLSHVTMKSFEYCASISFIRVKYSSLRARVIPMLPSVQAGETLNALSTRRPLGPLETTDRPENSCTPKPQASKSACSLLVARPDSDYGVVAASWPPENRAMSRAISAPPRVAREFPRDRRAHRARDLAAVRALICHSRVHKDDPRLPRGARRPPPSRSPPFPNGPHPRPTAPNCVHKPALSRRAPRARGYVGAALNRFALGGAVSASAAAPPPTSIGAASGAAGGSAAAARGASSSSPPPPPAALRVAARAPPFAGAPAPLLLLAAGAAAGACRCARGPAAAACRDPGLSSGSPAARAAPPPPPPPPASAAEPFASRLADAAAAAGRARPRPRPRRRLEVAWMRKPKTRGTYCAPGGAERERGGSPRASRRRAMGGRGGGRGRRGGRRRAR